jgi:hypothetical protein
MSKDTQDTEDGRWVVAGGIATVETQVGAGRARVDIQPGEPLPDDVSEAERTALLARGAIVREGDDPDGEGPAFAAPDGVAVVRPVPGVVEPDEIDRDAIPGGSVAQVMDWVGDDLARARVALYAENAKGQGARAGLIKKLEAVKASEETEPNDPPEVLDEDLNVTGGRVDGSDVLTPGASTRTKAASGTRDAKSDSK